MGLLYVATLVALVQLCFADQPSDPAPWPHAFTQKFSETFTYPVLGAHKTKGTFYYDFKNLRYRIDRDNGRYDRYCGFNGVRAFQDTPCSQLVIEGQRWLIYPEKKDCCKCCTSAQGCGILKPDWTKGALFVGEEGNNYKWNQKGLQDNFYVERKSDRRMVQIDQVPNDTQDYDPDSFQPTVDPKVFELPDYCKGKGGCSYASTCQAVGR